MNNELMFSSNDDSWATPQDFFDLYNSQFGFTTDVCATPDSAKCEKFWTEQDDAFKQCWRGILWMNPPYGRQIGKWIEKAYVASLDPFLRSTVVCLLPARTDTKWFHELCKKGEITFIKGRLTFGTDKYWNWLWKQEFINGKKNSLFGKVGKKNPAPFPSMVVVFKPQQN